MQAQPSSAPPGASHSGATSSRSQTSLALTQARLRRGWTQQELADRLGTTAQTVSRWERGAASPGPYHRQKLSDLFGMSPAELGLLPDDLAEHIVPENEPPDDAHVPIPALAPTQTGENAKTMPLSQSQHRAFLPWHMPVWQRIAAVALGALLLVAVVLTVGTRPSFFIPTPNSNLANVLPGTIAFESSERFQGNSAQGMNDEVAIHLAHIPAPAPGTCYYAWMATSQGSEAIWMPLGRLTWKAGVASLSYRAPQHTNLLVAYFRFLITEETTTIPPQQPSSVWVYVASISTIPMPGDPHHYSLFDHLHHLLAYDPALAKAGIQGGLDYWLTRNTRGVQQESSGLVTDWHTHHLADLRQRLIRILDYLDGSTYVGSDVPAGTPLLVPPPFASIGLLTLSPEQEPPGYVLHTDIHLEGVMRSPGATTSQQQVAGQLRMAMNAVGLSLSNARQDAVQLARMDDAHLAQPKALQLVIDLAVEAKDAYNGQLGASTGPTGAGARWIEVTIQRLAIFNWQRA